LASVDELPVYAPMLADYHRAFESELRAMVARLPVKEGSLVLDVGCGDGVYASWLAERVGPAGLVVAVDMSYPFLQVARRRAGYSATECRARLASASIEHLPFADDSFDLVWCAQSLYSLPDPVEALRRMKQVVRPGGVVAVLENDTLHHILLPWPVEVELPVRGAELEGFIEVSDKPRKFYIGRQLRGVFRAAGLGSYRERTWATNRQAPLRRHERSFLEKYLKVLRERAAPRLEPPILDRFERLVDPGSERYILDSRDLTLTCLDHVVWGVKPGASNRARVPRSSP
jgi:ubiquinone/menaquinone biosynthesis C-methylase UbiE